MGNHVHLVVIPEHKDSLAKGLGRTHNDYARWYHVPRGQTGHLWQNRFYSCPVDEARVPEVLCYVELNPVRAGLVDKPWDWLWSSARAHVSGKDETGLLNMKLWERYCDAASWRTLLETSRIDGRLQDEIRAATRTGRPLGPERFVEELEQRTGRTLRPHKRGQKPRHSI